MSKAAARVAPSAAWMSHAVAGRRRSGVAVLRMITSSSPACTPARSIAMRDASAPSAQVVSPSPAMCRSEMPVRSITHSCVVSMPIAAKS